MRWRNHPYLRTTSHNPSTPASSTQSVTPAETARINGPPHPRNSMPGRNPAKPRISAAPWASPLRSPATRKTRVGVASITTRRWSR